MLDVSGGSHSDEECNTVVRGDSNNKLLDALSLSTSYAENVKRERKKSLLISPTHQVPDLVQQCFTYLETHGLHTLGIFRVGCSKKRTRQLREEFDAGADIKLTNKEINSHDVASLLKEFFRDLPEPLLTYELYSAFVATQKLSEPEKQMEALRLLIALLPKPNRDTLWLLLKFLSKVANYSSDRIDADGIELQGNKMDSHNLATLFGPNVLHKSKGHERQEFQVESLERAEQRKEVIDVFQAIMENFLKLYEVPADLHGEIYEKIAEIDPDALEYLLKKKVQQTAPTAEVESLSIDSGSECGGGGGSTPSADVGTPGSHKLTMSGPGGRLYQTPLTPTELASCRDRARSQSSKMKCQNYPDDMMLEFVDMEVHRARPIEVRGATAGRLSPTASSIGACSIGLPPGSAGSGASPSSGKPQWSGGSTGSSKKEVEFFVFAGHSPTSGGAPSSLHSYTTSMEVEAGSPISGRSNSIGVKSISMSMEPASPVSQRSMPTSISTNSFTGGVPPLNSHRFSTSSHMSTQSSPPVTNMSPHASTAATHAATPHSAPHGKELHRMNSSDQIIHHTTPSSMTTYQLSASSNNLLFADVPAAEHPQCMRSLSSGRSGTSTTTGDGSSTAKTSEGMSRISASAEQLNLSPNQHRHYTACPQRRQVPVLRGPLLNSVTARQTAAATGGGYWKEPELGGKETLV